MFAAEALKLGGKPDDEVRRMGAVDAADDQVEALYAARDQIVHSPIHRVELSRRVQTAVVILSTSLDAGRHPDPIVRRTGALLAERLTTDLTGRRPKGGYFRAITQLGADLAEQNMPGIEKIVERPILVFYDASTA